MGNKVITNRHATVVQESQFEHIKELVRKIQGGRVETAEALNKIFDLAKGCYELARFGHHVDLVELDVFEGLIIANEKSCLAAVCHHKKKGQVEDLLDD